jgi:spermidine synthase
MATIWRHDSAEKHYKVTQAGQSLRLYRDNVCHSQWNPNNPFSGHLWNLFCLSVFNQPVKNICVLGVGGGSVINTLSMLFPSANIVGVDLDELHLYIAKNFFGVSKHCNLIHADAEQWLKTQKGKIYDLIVDDIFSEATQVPFRSVNSDVRWFQKLFSILKPNGTLVANFADKKDWRKARQYLAQVKHVNTYQCGVAQHIQCENQIIHLSQRDMSARQLRYQMKAAQHKVLAKLWDKGVFNYRRVPVK